MKKLVIHTPLSESVIISIVPKELVQNFILKSQEIYEEIQDIIAPTKVYKMPNLSLFIEYTINDFGILVNNISDYSKIINEEFLNSGFTLIPENNVWYYKFKPSSEYIQAFLDKPYIEIIKQRNKKKGISLLKREWKVICFDDGSILNYLERAPKVYQGDWFYNKAQFNYFWDNNYTTH